MGLAMTQRLFADGHIPQGIHDISSTDCRFSGHANRLDTHGIPENSGFFRLVGYINCLLLQQLVYTNIYSFY